ncbi:MAG: HNH endonuclease [candidate division Zixibacteria bacterium]|nr:HNH endonuclease [candidate division Zixibacteria bacterium]
MSAGRRKPGPGETLHHRNHNKQDNRDANLRLMPIPKHASLHSRRQPRDRNGRFAL